MIRIALELIWWQEIVKILLLLLILTKDWSWLSTIDITPILISWNKCSCLSVKLIPLNFHVTGVSLDSTQLISLYLLLIIIKCCVVKSSLLADSLTVFCCRLTLIILNYASIGWILYTSHCRDVFSYFRTLSRALLALSNLWVHHRAVGLSASIHLCREILFLML